MTSSKVALQVAQQAISVLANWAGVNLPPGCKCSNEHPAVERAKGLLWSKNPEPNSLRLLFDHVRLTKDQDSESQNVEVDNRENYYPATFIEVAGDDEYPHIPYPKAIKPSLDFFKTPLRNALESLESQDWQNLSLLMLFLEKFGSFISIDKANNDIALIDMVRTTAAVSAALVHNYQAEKITLIAGDLSGIQKFIYTISSEGALKSLRARSFYLEMVASEVVQQILAALELPRTSVIYAGGGNFYLLAVATNETKTQVMRVQYEFNKWLLLKFQSKVYLALDCLEFPASDVLSEKFKDYWNNVIKTNNLQKNCKFNKHIQSLLAPRDSFGDRCRVCYRDDTTDLDRLNPYEDGSVQACPTCREMFKLGNELFEVSSIVRSPQKFIEGAVHTIAFDFNPQSTHNCYYHLFKSWNPVVKDTETAFLINDWTIEHYRFRYFRNQVTPLLLANYGKESEEEKSKFMRAIEMANKAEGIKRVGYLRMDVDNLGKIFAQGLNEKNTLPRLAGISRQMSYFFKIYLNSLAKNRQDNFIQYHDESKYLTEQPRDNLLFIYAGGDDLFVSGSWSEVVEFAFDIYLSFRKYTGWNPDITLSGGISINDVKYPLYQAAEDSGDAEKAAKGNGRDSLGLFGENFKWSEWLGTADISMIEAKEKDYWQSVDKHKIEPEFLLGVLPIVLKLYKQLAPNYSRSFIQNLLGTAEIQELMIKEIEDGHKEKQYETQTKDIRYYLNLPKIAYTLARLPKNVTERDEFKPVRISLKSPYNAPYFRAIATWIELLTRKKP